MSTTPEQERRRYASVAVSFGDREALKRHGSGVATLVCPECGAQGARYGNPDEEHRFAGFSPVTEGGKGFILCVCDSCKHQVTLPHARA